MKSGTFLARSSLHPRFFGVYFFVKIVPRARKTFAACTRTVSFLSFHHAHGKRSRRAPAQSLFFLFTMHTENVCGAHGGVVFVGFAVYKLGVCTPIT